MTKKLTIGSESFDYPVTGDINYGEGATGWSESVTSAISEFFGPGDIKTTEAALANNSTGIISGLVFDTSFVQRITVSGFITRVVSGVSLVEAFLVTGAYNGIVFNISNEYTGDDTDVELTMVGGQFYYTAADITGTTQVKIKFSAKALIDADAV